MKPRKVIVTIEMTTDVKVDALRDKEAWKWRDTDIVHQIQVNVVKPVKK